MTGMAAAVIAAVLLFSTNVPFTNETCPGIFRFELVYEKSYKNSSQEGAQSGLCEKSYKF